ncbi:MAG: phage/plasmid primase, P4 family [Mucilaginibacter sp.]
MEDRDDNKKIIIPENTDLNNLSIEPKVVENIIDDKTLMGRAIQNEPTLKKILDNITPLDFVDIASKGRASLLRKKMFDTKDQTLKEKLEKEIKGYEPDEDSKNVIVMEGLLNVANDLGTGLIMTNSTSYFYNGHYWERIHVNVLANFLGSVAEKTGIPWLKARQHKMQDKLLKQFTTTAAFKEPEIKDGEIKINLLDGTYCINHNKEGELGELRTAKKEDFFKYQLPFGHDPRAQAKLFIKYLNQVLPDVSAQMVLMEYIAYIFTKMKLEKTLFLYGLGANGKSVFFEIITALLGESNVSHYPMDRLLDPNGYTRAMIENKLVNYCPELGGIKDIQLFKRLSSGEPVDARLPYGEPFILKNYGKLIFNTNDLPQAEQTEAFFRRPIIIHFNQTIPESERDINLAKKIIDTELSGIFNIVLKSLDRLVKQGGFTKSAFIDEQLLNYKKESNSVAQFLENEQWVKSSTNNIALKDFYPHYVFYCKHMGLIPVGSSKFSSRLRMLGYKVDKAKQGGYFHVWCEMKIDDDFMDMSVIKSIIQ